MHYNNKYETQGKLEDCIIETPKLKRICSECPQADAVDVLGLT